MKKKTKGNYINCKIIFNLSIFVIPKKRDPLEKQFRFTLERPSYIILEPY